MEILENIPVILGHAELKKRLHMEQREEWSQVETLITTAQPLIAARAAYKISYIDEKLSDAVVVDGVRLTSKVLRKNLDQTHRAFPYVVTIGPELEESAGVRTDLLERFVLETIGDVAVGAARRYLHDNLTSRYALGGASYMSPGSLGDWPIGEQRPLFSLLGDVEGAIGVRLNPSLLMLPRKSVSGILFPTEHSFSSCQLCPREACPSRKAEYNEQTAREYGVLK